MSEKLDKKNLYKDIIEFILYPKKKTDIDLEESIANIFISQGYSDYVPSLKLSNIVVTKPEEQIHGGLLQSLKSELDEVKKELKEIKSYLIIKEDKKEESLLHYKSLIKDIKEVCSVYCIIETDVLKIWTLISKDDAINTLKKLVKINIEMDNTFPDIVFDFDITPINDETEIDTYKWNPLFKR